MKIITDADGDESERKWDVLQRAVAGDISQLLRKSDRLNLVEILLQSEKLSVNVLTSSSQTLLHLLCSRPFKDSQFDAEENSKIATLLIKNGVDFNHKDAKEKTALMLACENGHTFIVEVLVDLKWTELDINAVDSSEKSAFIIAAHRKNSIAFNLLTVVAFLQSVNQGDMKAVARFLNSSRQECVRKFGTSSRINDSPFFEFSCVEHIGRQFPISLITSDVERPSGSCIKFYEWLDAVCIAEDSNSVSMLELLFQFENIVYGVTGEGFTALHMSVVQCQSRFKYSGYKKVKILLRSGKFDVNALTSQLDTVVHLACRFPAFDASNCEKLGGIIREFLCQKVNVNQRNMSGQTALMIACASGNSVAVRELLKWKIASGGILDINAKDNRGHTALSLANQSHNADITSMIEELVFLAAVEDGDREIVANHLNGSIRRPIERISNESDKNEEIAESFVYVHSNNIDSYTETAHNYSNLLSTSEIESEVLVRKTESNTNFSGLEECTVLEDDIIFENFPFKNEGTDEVETQFSSTNSISHSVWLESVYIASCKSNEENLYNDILKLLLNDDLYMRKCNEDGQTVLHSAIKEYIDNKCETKALKKIEILLKSGKCDVNVLNSQKETVLHLVCSTESAESPVLDDILSILHGYKVDLNPKNNSGKTALSIACKNRNTNVVRTLLNLTTNNRIDLVVLSINTTHEQKTFNNLDRSGQMGKASNFNSKIKKKKCTSIYAFDFWTWEEAVVVAIENSFEDILSLLLGYDAVVQRQFVIYGDPILMWCLERGKASEDMSLKIFEKLLESGTTNVNATDFRADTALHRYFNIKFSALLNVVQMLLSRGADMNQKDKDGYTPVKMACSPAPELTAVLKLIMRFAKTTGTWLDVDAKDAFGRTALMWAAVWKRSDAVGMLLNAGASVNLSDHRGFTALHHALHEFMSAETWINYGDFPRNAEEFKITKEIKAVLYNNEAPNCMYLKNRKLLNRHKIKAVKMLLESKDIDVNALTSEGYSPLDIAIATIPNIHSSIRDKLIKKGAILNTFQNENQQLQCNVHTSVGLNALHRCGILLANDGKFVNDDLIMEFRSNGNMNKIAKKNLLKLDANVQNQWSSQRDQRGRTPLHCAVICGRQVSEYRDISLSLVIETVEMLISVGCSVNETDIYGRTPLHYASNREVEKLLLDKDADPAIEDNDRISASQMSNALQEKQKTLQQQQEDVVRGVVTEAMQGIGGYEDNFETRMETPNSRVKGNIKSWKDLNPKVITENLWENGDYACRHPSVNEIRDEVTEFIQDLAAGMKRQDWRFEVDPVLVGSSYEGTKIHLPDEFDFSFVLTKVSPLCEVSPSPELPSGFVHLRRKQNNADEAENKEFDSFFNIDLILMVEKLYVQFRNILTNILKDPQFIEAHQNFEWGYDIGIEGLVPWDAKFELATTLELRKTRFDLGNRRIIDISIDIVPCIHIDGWWPDEAITKIGDDTEKVFSCNFVFCRPQKLYSWVPYSESCARISFAPAESEMIRRSSDTAKQAFMIGKQLLKKACHLFWKTSRFVVCDTSYVLKNCFLYCNEALTTKSDGMESGLGLSEDTLESKLQQMDRQLWLESLMKCHLDFVSRDFCPCYFMPNFSIPVGDCLKQFHLQCLSNENYEIPERLSVAYQLYRIVSLNASRFDFHLPPLNSVFEHFNREAVIADIRASAIENLRKGKRCS